jgi:hypothetical protein
MAEFGEFLARANDWTTDEFEAWWRRGATKFADKEHDNRWPLGFTYLLLSENSDPADQTLAAINELHQTAYHKACVAAERLLDRIPTGASPLYVEFFFKLAGTLKPRGLAAALHLLLNSQAVLDGFDAWIKAIQTGIVALCNYPYSEEVDDIVADVRPTPAWSPSLVRHCVLAKLRVRPRDWLAAVKHFEPDLRELKKHEPAQFFLLLRQLAKIVRSERIERELPRLIYGDYRQISWVADDLVGKENNAGKGRNPVVITNTLFLKVGNAATKLRIVRDDQTEEQTREYMEFVASKSTQVVPAFVAREQLLKTLAEVEMAV